MRSEPFAATRRCKPSRPVFGAVLVLLVPALAVGQDTRPVPRVDAELLFGHPGLISGDDAAVRADILRALEARPDAPLAIEALHVLDWHDDGITRDEVARLLALVPRLTDGEAVFQARGLALREAERWRFSDAPFPADLDGGGRSVSHWHVVGPLGPLDHRAPAAMDAPPSSPELAGAPDAAQYVAADGRPREWVLCQRLNRADWFVHPCSYVHPAGGVTYAAAFIKARQPLERAVLEVRTPGAFRAWWNGALVHDERRATPSAVGERFLADVEVGDGWNVLLVRLVTDEDAPLGARLLDPAGREVEIDDFALDPASVTAAKSSGTAVALRTQRLGADVSDGSFGPALAAARALIAERPDLALAVAPPADDPRGLAAWRLVRLRALNGSNHMPDEVERRMTLELLATLATEGPYFGLARSLRVRQLQREDRPLDALAAAEEWVAAAPDLAAARLARVACLGQLDRSGVMRRIALEEVCLAHPEHSDARVALAEARLEAGDEVGAQMDFWRALQGDATEERALGVVLGYARRTGDEARVRFLLERTEEWWRANPHDGATRRRVESLYEELGRRRDVLATRELALGMHPEQPDLHWEVGEYHLRLGEVERAREALRRELALDPADPTTRETLRLLGEEDLVERFFAEFAPDIDAALERAESVTDASVIEALDSGLVYLFPDGSSHARFHTLSVPRDRKGTEALHEHPLEDDVRLARIRSKDGRELEPIEIDGTWTLPSIEPGDVVEFVWDTYAPGVPGAPPDERGWRFSSFEKAFPTSRWVMFVPTGLPGRLDVRNFDGTHEVLERAGGTVHVLTASYPRFVDEPLRPSDIEVLPVAAYGGDRARDDELQLWDMRLRSLCELPADLEREVGEFVTEHTRPEPLATAEALYRALDERVREQGGEARAAQVWWLQRGLPLFLLAALYERAGVPFEWAVMERGVSPELDPEPVEAFAGQRPVERFALRLGVVDSSGEHVWIVPTGQPGTAFGALPPQMAGAAAWVRGSEGWRTEELPRTQLEATWDADIELVYTLDPKGDAAVRGRFVVGGPAGDAQRRQLREAPAQQRNGHARQMVNAVVRGLDIAEASYDLDAAEPGAILVFAGKLPGFVAARGEEFIADPPFLPLGLDQGLGPAERKWALVFRASTRVRVRATLELGETWRLAGGPNPTTEAREGLAIDVTVDAADETRCLLEQRAIRRGFVVAAAEMPAFLARMGAVEAEFRRPLRFLRREGK
jgi:tetratricopeptide (TPR) repeat protein